MTKITGSETMAEMPIQLDIAKEVLKAVIANPTVINQITEGGNSATVTALKFADDLIKEYNKDKEIIENPVFSEFEGT